MIDPIASGARPREVPAAASRNRARFARLFRLLSLPPSPLRGGVDRNSRSGPRRRRPAASPLRGGVDRNSASASSLSALSRSPLRGGVDRNDDMIEAEHSLDRRPFAGAWIETFSRPIARTKRGCRPFAGAWIETKGKAALELAVVSPLRGGVDRNSISALPAGVTGIVAPSRGRGSKRQGRRGHPAGAGRRPFAGAWIETYWAATDETSVEGRPFAGAWIETS
jgi:hypothetical protein